MKLPDFFIVGAPKCGTTAMNDYLQQHPQVFIPRKKELHYFGSDLVFHRPPKITKEQYFSHFAEATDEKRVGEASVWYLYSKRAAAEIKAFCPSASIIIMLRNPVDMIHALHSQRVYNCNEDILDFEAALEAEEDRKKGLRLPKHMGNVMLDGFIFRETAKYTAQVQRYLDVFGWENVRIIIYDDFARDTARTYRETCEFLGVDPHFRPDLQVVNANKRIRAQGLQLFIRKASLASRRIAQALPLHLGVLKRLRRLNTEHVRRRPMRPELRRRLQLEFLPEVQRLSELLGRDLTHWCVAENSQSANAGNLDLRVSLG